MANVATKRAKVSPIKQPSEDTQVPELHDRIALRAYQIFEDRGRADGLDMEDWFRAEQEILSERIDTDLG